MFQVFLDLAPNLVTVRGFGAGLTRDRRCVGCGLPRPQRVWSNFRRLGPFSVFLTAATGSASTARLQNRLRRTSRRRPKTTGSYLFDKSISQRNVKPIYNRVRDAVTGKYRIPTTATATFGFCLTGLFYRRSLQVPQRSSRNEPSGIAGARFHSL